MRLGDKVIRVDQSRPRITLGRQSHNDVVVNDIRVSRTHARIEYRPGKFVLIDNSSNGTYVNIQGGKSISLRHDETPLTGNGIISLGREVDVNLSGEIPLIYFKMRKPVS